MGKQYREKVYLPAEKALETCNSQELGEIANYCHSLLQKLTVSCQELDSLCEIARNAGACGAKMAGTGRGGLMFAICDNEESQAKVREALEASAPQVWVTNIV